MIERRGFRTTYRAAGRNLVLVLSIGAVCGFLVGGIGGQLAMLLLRSAAAAPRQGLTDEGLAIGVATNEIAFAMITTTVLGLFAAPLYIVVRDWLPPRGRPMLFGAWTGALGGAALLHPSAFDAASLTPAWLAIALFIALPVAFGAVPALALERAYRFRRPPSVAPMIPVVALPTGLFFFPIFVACALFLALDRRRQIDRVWRSQRVTWMGRIALGGGFAYAGLALARGLATLS